MLKVRMGSGGKLFGILAKSILFEEWQEDERVFKHKYVISEASGCSVTTPGTALRDEL